MPTITTVATAPRALAAGAVPILVLVVAACSSSTADPSADPSGGSVNGEAACGQYLDALSHQATGCLPLGIPASSLYKAVDKPLATKQCVLDLAAPGTSWSPAFLSGCAADMQKLNACQSKAPACQPPPGALADGAGCAKGTQCKGGICRVNGTPPNGQPTFCGSCATGLPEGGDCKSSSDCERTLFCLAGKCAKTPTPGAEGAACTQKDASGAASSSLPTLPCESGLYCNTIIIPALPPAPTSTKVPTCERLRGKGAACTFTECQPALRCTGGACVDPADARDDGADCATAGDCKSGYCDITAKKCKAVTIGGVGAPCRQGFLCADGLACHGTTDETSICVERLAEGAACTTNGSPCATNTVCRNGTCQLNDPALCH